MSVLLLGAAALVVGGLALWHRFVEPIELLQMTGLGGAGDGEGGGEVEPADVGETGSTPADLPGSETGGEDSSITEAQTDGEQTDGEQTGGVAAESAETNDEDERAETNGEGESESESEGHETGGAAAERQPPPGTFRAGAGIYIAPLEPGPTTDLAGAKQYCANLAQQQFAGESGWSLPNPAELSKFVGSREIKRGKYWTTALHAGRGKVFSMPGGKRISEKADRKAARPLCVTKF